MDAYQGIAEVLEEMGVPKEKIRPVAGLVTDLDLDSLEMLEFASQLEEKFNIQVSDETIPGSATVGDVVETIHRLRGELK